MQLQGVSVREIPPSGRVENGAETEGQGCTPMPRRGQDPEESRGRECTAGREECELEEARGARCAQCRLVQAQPAQSARGAQCRF
eukprot:5609162-Alexandrium_andersonii.AAC.1